jgi:hypothetical protein
VINMPCSTPATAQYLSIDGNHSMANCYAFAINNPTQPQEPVSAQPNVVTGREPGHAILPAAVIPAPWAGMRSGEAGL